MLWGTRCRKRGEANNGLTTGWEQGILAWRLYSSSGHECACFRSTLTRHAASRHNAAVVRISGTASREHPRTQWRIALRSLPALLAALSSLAWALLAGGGEREPVASFTVREHFGVSHPPQVIDFDLAKPCTMENVHVLGPSGEPVAFQLLDGGRRLAVVADLPAGAERTWRLMPGVKFRTNKTKTAASAPPRLPEKEVQEGSPPRAFTGPPCFV